LEVELVIRDSSSNNRLGSTHFKIAKIFRIFFERFSLGNFFIGCVCL
jgi:hypothetical protein